MKAITALVIVLMCSGCAGISGQLPAPVSFEPGGEFLVGAAKVDITPMPGYPMGGYAVAGQISRGAWMRLKARAFCFEDAHGRSLAMVSADLWAMPAGLADRVADLVATEHGIGRLAREQILLAATHTHNGPGNFSSSKLYNQMASPEGGFDRELFDFLAHRMASAIAEAWHHRVPATLEYSETPVVGLARNRSMEPFLANGEDALALIEENRGYPIRKTPFPVGGEDAYRALDQNLKALGIQLLPENRQLVLRRIVELGDKKHTVTAEDLPMIIADVLKKPPEELVKIERYEIVSTKGDLPTANLALRYRGEEVEAQSDGDGGYDAFMKALAKACRKFDIKMPQLVDYSVRIPPTGKTGALVETVITWRKESRSRPFSTLGVDSDQVAAAVIATEKMLNLIVAA
jgi:hypothetical protein